AAAAMLSCLIPRASPQPWSILFPYTTLFRSGVVYNNFGQEELSEEYRKKAFELRDRASERERLYITAHYYADSGDVKPLAFACSDRKSTRLNSSHGSISYAVFCLKKKNIAHNSENAKPITRDEKLSQRALSIVAVG